MTHDLYKVYIGILKLSNFCKVMSGIWRSELLLMVTVHTCTLYFVEIEISITMNHNYQMHCKNLEEQQTGLASLGFCLKLLSKVEQNRKMCYAEGIRRVNDGGQTPDSVLVFHYFLDLTPE